MCFVTIFFRNSSLFHNEKIFTFCIMSQHWYGAIGLNHSTSIQDSVCLVHPGVRDKRRVSEIDLPSLGMRQLFGDVTIGQWRHN